VNNERTNQTEIEVVEAHLADWRKEYDRLESELLSSKWTVANRPTLLEKKLELADKIRLAEQWLAGQRVKNNLK
jgi:hypothetical protein